jgi:hypothetical protein
MNKNTADFGLDLRTGLKDEAQMIELLTEAGFKVLPATDKSHDFELFHVTLKKWVTIDLKVQRINLQNIVVETHTFRCDEDGNQIAPKQPSGIAKYNFDVLLTWHKPTDKLYFMSRAEIETWLASQTPEQLSRRRRLTRINRGPAGGLFRAVVWRIEPDDMVRLSFAVCDLNDPDWDQAIGCFSRT